MTVVGDYQSTALSHLNVQLYGLVAGTEYDSIAVQSNATMAGAIDVELYFDAAIGDSFTILNTWGTITSCALPATTTAIYNGQLYTFTVGCQNDNKVVLTLAAKVVLANENFAALDKQIILAPNPAKGVIFLKNQSNVSLDEAAIVDFSGRIIQKIKFNGVDNEKEIYIGALSAGHYFIKIDAEDHNIIKRFIVE